MTKLIITFTLIIIGITACNKTIDASNKDYMIISKTINSGTNKTSNNLTIGELHNHFLSEVFKDFNYNTGNHFQELTHRFSDIELENVNYFYPKIGTYTDVVNDNLSQEALVFISSAIEIYKNLETFNSFEAEIILIENEIVNSNLTKRVFSYPFKLVI